MGLSVGTRLGPYEIVAPLGAGGMGEVYRARDTRLDRTVAVKVLNSALTATPDLKARFEREAKTISQLNHPNICVLHDVGHEGNVDFLVMEFLEGESLADRIKNKGALPLAELIKIGCEVAEALDKAHRAGIVHRDLKPGNIMLTKTGAKLLDFGLAKGLAVQAASGAAAAGQRVASSAPLLSAAMTMTSPSPQHSPLTQQGSLVGTVQYMSPEQIQGMEADARSDIFAFGAVLYEMATGKRAFEGKSQIKVASAILEDDPPPIATLMRAAPASLDGLIRSCLAKDPDARYASAHDIAIQLRSVGESRGEVISEQSRVVPRNIGWAAAAVLAIAMIPLAFWLWRGGRVATSAPALAFVPAPAGTRLLAFGFGAGPVTVSPDATKLAFTAIDGQGTIKLWLRRLDSRVATPVQGTENASAPFWSPDSQSIGFFADSKLKTVALGSGRVEVLCDGPGYVMGGAWGTDGTILFGNPVGKPMSKIAASGGSPSPWAPLSGGTFQSFPAFLPDGDHFLYVSANAQQQPRIEMGSLSSGGHSVVMENASDPAYASGFLVYLRGNKVLAQPFNASSGKVSGTAVPVSEASRFSVAGPVLAFQSYATNSRLQWYGLGGEAQNTIGAVTFYDAPKISPDGTQVLALVHSAESGVGDLWTIPAAGGPSTRLTFNADPVHSVWSPDGKYVAYGRVTNGKAQIARKPADGSGSEEVLVEFGTDIRRSPVVDWSPDGRYLSYDAFSMSRGRLENWILPLFGDRKPFQVAPSSANQYDGNFSPDGHWLAYFSYDSGRSEVYVVPFPGPGGKYQISTNGGWLVRWANKNHLFFLTTGNQLMDADLALGTNSLQIRSIHPLFQLPLTDLSAPLFDVTADGKRIIAVTPADPEANSIGILLNWQSELKK